VPIFPTQPPAPPKFITAKLQATRPRKFGEFASPSSSNTHHDSTLMLMDLLSWRKYPYEHPSELVMDTLTLKSWLNIIRGADFASAELRC
jgi:hypothetical protein